jgi:hypothetical protein
MIFPRFIPLDEEEGDALRVGDAERIADRMLGTLVPALERKGKEGVGETLTQWVGKTVSFSVKGFSKIGKGTLVGVSPLGILA